jgi:hypothetical protein
MHDFEGKDSSDLYGFVILVGMACPRQSRAKRAAGGQRSVAAQSRCVSKSDF